MPIADTRHQWGLDPRIAQLNHGGFGVTPLPVQQEQQHWRDLVEADPSEFYMRRHLPAVAEVRAQVAEFLDADPEGLAFVANATTGVQTALDWLAPRLRPGDEIVTTDHCYAAVQVQLRLLAERTGASVVVARLPMPVPSADALVSAVVDVMNARTRALVVDHVTSPTAIVLPVERLVAECRDRGVISVVDGAHAPGLLPLSLRAIDADFYAGNLHKWVGVPKTAAVFSVHSSYRESVRPLVASHYYDDGMLPAFDVVGTADVTPILAAPAALQFFGDLGWDCVRRHNRDLAAAGAGLVASALGTTLPVPDELSAAMRIVALPAPLGWEDGRRLSARLHDEHAIEVPFTGTGADVEFVRVAAQVYNTIDDYARLADVLPGLLR